MRENKAEIQRSVSCLFFFFFCFSNKSFYFIYFFLFVFKKGMAISNLQEIH